MKSVRSSILVLSAVLWPDAAIGWRECIGQSQEKLLQPFVRLQTSINGGNGDFYRICV